MRIAGSYDVLIGGGGTAGTVAAVAAARNGANTLIVEKSGCLGGLSTEGLVNSYVTFHDHEGNQVIKGIAEEIIDRLNDLGETTGHAQEVGKECYMKALFDSEILKFVLLEMAEESGVNLLLDTYITDATLEDNRLKGVVVENKSGRQLLLSNICIDATGDADIAAFAGTPFEKESKKNLQAVTLMFRLGNVDMAKWLTYMKQHPEQFDLSINPEDLDKYKIIENPFKSFPPFKKAIENKELPLRIMLEQVWFTAYDLDTQRRQVTINATRIDEIDGTDATDLTKAEIETRKQVIPFTKFLKKYAPGFENCYISATASQIGVRESRRIVGEYTITQEDILKAKRFEDAVGKGATPIDIHAGSANGGRFFWIKTKKGGIAAYDIPYRCLVPQKIDNLLVAGRCISATHRAQGGVRMMPVCLVTGQAAGTAAALCMKDKVPPRKLEVRKLQNLLREQGVIV